MVDVDSDTEKVQTASLHRLSAASPTTMLPLPLPQEDYLGIVGGSGWYQSAWMDILDHPPNQLWPSG